LGDVASLFHTPSHSAWVIFIAPVALDEPPGAVPVWAIAGTARMVNAAAVKSFTDFMEDSPRCYCSSPPEKRRLNLTVPGTASSKRSDLSRERYFSD